ncbi:MAG: hypothetical protein J2P26_01915 [Nocardiopsaceae bacterium]|nr:hypothetical protein [Nocardiopsaceae bacterium]
MTKKTRKTSTPTTPAIDTNVPYVASAAGKLHIDNGQGGALCPAQGSYTPATEKQIAAAAKRPTKLCVHCRRLHDAEIDAIDAQADQAGAEEEIEVREMTIVDEPGHVEQGPALESDDDGDIPGTEQVTIEIGERLLAFVVNHIQARNAGANDPELDRLYAIIDAAPCRKMGAGGRTTLRLNLAQVSVIIDALQEIGEAMRAKTLRTTTTGFRHPAVEAALSHIVNVISGQAA